MARIVLVADDSPTIQKKAMAILKGEGFEVETVSNGVAAIKRLAVLRPTVVLADVSMPGRDGYEVCEFVKRSEQHAQVPVLLVASDMEPYDDARGAQVRADGIIKKPFESRELIDIVVRFAEKFEAESAAPVPSPVVEAAPESVQAVPVSPEELEEMPTAALPVPPDFSAHSGGVAFAEPVGEEVPANYDYSESPQVEAEASYGEPQLESEIAAGQAPAYEYSEEFSEPGAESPNPPAHESAPAPPYSGPTSAPPDPAPANLEGFGAVAPEPVFIEEDAAHLSHHSAHHHAESQTMIFRAPLEIAEPVWSDDTVPSAEPSAALEPEAQPEVGQSANPREISEYPLNSDSNNASVSVTSLDSFSLDDAAAGQVHFASHPAEVVEADYSQSFAPHEAASEVAEAEQGPAEVAPVELPSVEVAAPEEVHEEAHLDAAAPVSTSETPTAEFAAAEPEPESPATDVAFIEKPDADVIPLQAPVNAAPLDAAPPAPVESHAPAAAVAPPEEPAIPEYDWSFIYSIVHRVVVRMSPPALPLEVVEELARRLGDEIASEVANESSQPPA